MRISGNDDSDKSFQGDEDSAARQMGNFQHFHQRKVQMGGHLCSLRKTSRDHGIT
jgi:hypothetical protein